MGDTLRGFKFSNKFARPNQIQTSGIKKKLLKGAFVFKCLNMDKELKDVFITKTPKQWFKEAAKIPDPKMLFDEIWYEGELCFFFSTPGAGKTILAFQIAQSIATGISIHEEMLKMTAKPKKVFYLDIELSIKQFEARYKNKTSGEYYDLSDNILRAVLDFSSIDYDNLANIESVIIESLKKAAINKGIEVFIIDNITSIYDPNDFRRAIKFMHKLMRMKKTLNMSMLVLGHTPKRDMTQPLEIYSMAGSANLPNLIDSMFALGISNKENNRRYIKEIKNRNDEKKYGEKNVLDVIITRESGCLSFEICGSSEEWTHLKKPSQNEKRNADIIEAYQSGDKQIEIAENFGISDRQVRNIIQNHKQAPKDDLSF